MSPFAASHFFDLSTYAHRALFEGKSDVWLILKEISSYLASQKLGTIEGVVESGAYLVNPETIVIGKGSVVESGAYIKGPCIIGEGCEVRHGAYLRGNVITGNKCVLGHATEVKNSIFLDEAHAGHFAYVGDSIVGNRVNLGAGVKCANLRLDGSCISVYWEGKKVETDLRKLGAILGDDVQLGCNCVTNPGTLMEKKTNAHPCLNIKGYIKKDEL